MMPSKSKLDVNAHQLRVGFLIAVQQCHPSMVIIVLTKMWHVYPRDRGHSEYTLMDERDPMKLASNRN